MVERIPVLIAGGGPVGLTLGIDLAHRGVRSLLVEPRHGPTEHPKATLLGARSMELFRRWGLDEEIYEACIRQKDAYYIVFCDRLAGHELHRFASPPVERIRARDPDAAARWRELAWSPYGKTQIGQQALEPVLLRHAARLPALTMRHGWRLVAFEELGDHVRATLEDVASGVREEVEADWLVGCDGGSSGVRRALGGRMHGRGRIRSNVSYLFRSQDFLKVHGKGLANLYFCFTPGCYGVFTAIDGREVWNYQYYWADPTRDDTAPPDDPAKILHAAMGRPFDFELLGTTHWYHHQSVAAEWRRGRVFLAGDAAHLFVPTGGVGMNTGIGDAADLAWKLAAVLEGWGGDALLDSYEAERKPVAIRNSLISATNSDRIDMVMAETPPHIGDADARGALARARLKDRLIWMSRQFNSAGVHLGYRYVDSPAIVPDGTPEPPDDPNQLVPSTWPGSRLPHAWLPDGRSTLDLLGRGFTLVGASLTPEAPRLLAAMRAAGMPVSVQRCDAGLPGGPGLVLVRPDGHVGWRGTRDPVDAERIVATLSGRGATAQTRAA
jgi:2-polyprenyl-6-methoxyphenol hydroxylase-like FAD-dependent oxidoreductase